MSNLTERLAMVPYQRIAEKIAEELDRRGFVTDDPDKADGLVLKMTEIIRNGVEGRDQEPPPLNLTPEEKAELDAEVAAYDAERDGMDDDLQNQL